MSVLIDANEAGGVFGTVCATAVLQVCVCVWCVGGLSQRCVGPRGVTAERGRASGDFQPSPRGWDYGGGAADAAPMRPAGARPAAVTLQR